VSKPTDRSAYLVRLQLAVTAAALAGAAVVVPSCGTYTRPGPTAKRVRVSDLVGSWRLETSGRTVTLVFHADGTFSERVTNADGRPLRRGGGTWALDGPNLHLKGYLASGGGYTHAISWYFADGVTGLTLLGGDSGDPDGSGPLRRIAGAEPPCTSPRP
jgi:hypothetical protein